MCWVHQHIIHTQGHASVKYLFNSGTFVLSCELECTQLFSLKLFYSAPEAKLCKFTKNLFSISMYARYNIACTMSEFLRLPIGSYWHARLCFSERNVVFKALCAWQSLVERFLYQSKAAGWKSTSQADSEAAASD